MLIVKYRPEFKEKWDKFIETSKNRHFFFKRDYMEYHKDRFEDFSLIVLDNYGNIITLLPANVKDNVLYSHQGLTFGGFIVNEQMKTDLMLDVFSLLKDFLLKNNITKIVYKCIPYIYHLLPAEEDRYALFIYDAKLIRRDVTTTIFLKNKLKYQDLRKRAIKKAIKNCMVFEESKDYENFWNILEQVLLEKHNTRPVHTVKEIKMLADTFPHNIRLFVAKKDDKMLGGTCVFENENVVHTQYLANSLEGRKLGALDFVIDNLINNVYKDKTYFDFGISTEKDGLYLNEGLIFQKEGFGGRAVVHDVYEINFI